MRESNRSESPIIEHHCAKPVYARLYNPPMSRMLPESLLPLLRRLADGRFHSGQALAFDSDMSRATVCNLVRVAKDLGPHRSVLH